MHSPIKAPGKLVFAAFYPIAPLNWTCNELKTEKITLIMKNFLSIFIFTLSFFPMLHAQVNDSIEQASTTIFKMDYGEMTTNPLYVIKIAEKTIKYRLNNKNFEETFLNELSPEWIESVNILKSEEAAQKSGSCAEDGAIIINLKKNTWAKMTPGLQSRFL